MNRKARMLFAVTSVIWGSSFLFIRVAVAHMPPPVVVFGRCALGALILVPLAVRTGALAGLRRNILPILVVTCLDMALPTFLTAWGEERVSSSVAGILTATDPLFTAVLALWLIRSEAVDRRRFTGLLIGFAGVVALLGFDFHGQAGELAGAGAVLLAAACFAGAALVYRRWLADTPALGVTAIMTVISTAVFAAPALLAPPQHAPPLPSILALAALGTVNTGLAYWLFYLLIDHAGAATAAVITYVMPVVALLLGVGLLGEDLTAGAIVGLILIALGAWLATSGIPARRLLPRVKSFRPGVSGSGANPSGNLGLLGLRSHSKETLMRPLEEETILITGATDGLGRALATELAATGATLLIHGRDDGRGQAAIDEIAAQSGNQRLEWLQADLASLDEVRELAGHVMAEHPRVDALVNNAGIGYTTGGDERRKESRDGYELRFAVNYLAGYLLTRLLLPHLQRSAPARIVNVASAGQVPIDFDDVMLTQHYDGARAYRQSKLAQIMFTFDLASELDPQAVTVNCLHPATYMPTKIVRDDGTEPVSSLSEGVRATLRLVADPGLDGVTGQYFDGLAEASPNSQAYDVTARRRLRDLSDQLCGLATAAGGPATRH